MEKFVVAGTQRSGTSVINQTLRSHPQIKTYGEVFLFSGRRGLLKKPLGQTMEGSYRQFINNNNHRRFISHNFSRRQTIYTYLDQLYHVLNHALLFGGQYIESAKITLKNLDS